MNREKFLNDLSWLLLDIPIDERNAALEYYESYFEEAGTDKEQEVIQQLGSPEKVAAIIHGHEPEDITNDNNMLPTETSAKTSTDTDTQASQNSFYKDNTQTEDNYYGASDASRAYYNASEEAKKRNPYGESAYTQNRSKHPYKEDTLPKKVNLNKNKSSNSFINKIRELWAKFRKQSTTFQIIVILIVVFIVAPSVFNIFGNFLSEILSIIWGIGGAIIGISVGLIVGTAGCFVGGLACLAFGVITCVSVLADGLVLMGLGLLMIAGGFFLGIVCRLYFGRFIPGFIRWIVKCWKKFISWLKGLGKNGEKKK